MNEITNIDELAKFICNKSGMPYAWQDIKYRLQSGKKLPFKLNHDLTIKSM